MDNVSHRSISIIQDPDWHYNSRSMGCVHYRWQLVFTNLINDNKLFIVYYYWLWSPDCAYMYAMIDIWLYNMDGWYTRLVTYVRLRILPLVISFYHDINYISFIALVLILIISLSFISVYYVVIAYIIFMHEQLFFTHTLIRSLLTTLDSHVQGIGYIVQVFVWSYSSRGTGVSPHLILVFSSLMSSCYFLILDICLRFSFYPSSFYMISCVDGYMWYCSDHWFIIV